MVEDVQVRDAASGILPVADIVSAWQEDFEQKKQDGSLLGARVLLTLPSHKQIKAIRLPLLLLMQSGSIPDKLTHIVTTFMQTIDTGKNDEQQIAAGFEAMFAENAFKAAQEWTEMLNFVFCNAVVSPRFVETEAEANPTEGVFWVGQVNFYDKLWLFQWTQGVDQSVQTFLLEQTAALGTASDGEGVRITTEQLLAGGESGNFLVGVADRPSNVDVGNVRPRKNRRNQGSTAEKDQTTNSD